MFQLTENDQHLLLQIARAAVEAYLTCRSPHLPDIPGGTLREPRGVFVSIHRRSELRGCIGNIYPAGPLYRSTAECAVGAAVGDPRFMPVMMPELSEIEFEISVLSPMEKVRDIGDIVVGKHGLLITRKTARGLLLPQVAVEYGWDRERFLEETCRKAGLGPDDWKDGADIQYFSALVFSERQFHVTAGT